MTKSIRVYDPPMCCSTGICGPNVDRDLVNFAALLAQLQKVGVAVERYNLAQQPMAFVQNAQVKQLLEAGGDKVLPLIFRDGELILQGRYPTSAERGELMRVAVEPPSAAPPA